jgi:hypothetical protein
VQTIDWTRIILQALFIVVPIIGTGYLAYKRLWWTLGEYRPHAHGEKDGPLTVDGIRYPRSMNGKGE